MLTPTRARCPALARPSIFLTGPSSQMIAASAAVAATTPRTSRIHWLSSSGRACTRGLAVGRSIMIAIRPRYAQAPTFQATSSRVDSRMTTGMSSKDGIGRDHDQRPRDQAGTVGERDEKSARLLFGARRLRGVGHAGPFTCKAAPALPDEARRVKPTHCHTRQSGYPVAQRGSRLQRLTFPAAPAAPSTPRARNPRSPRSWRGRSFLRRLGPDFAPRRRSEPWR